MAPTAASDGKSEIVVTLFIDEGWNAYLGHTTPADNK